MSRYHYPLQFTFQIATLANDFVVTDAAGNTVFYAREKILTLRDHIHIYSDQQKKQLLYELISNRLIDFQQTFTITDAIGRVVGKARRKSIRSLWKATFYLQDADGNHDFTIEEKSVWTRFWDGVFGDIPILGFFSGYVFNPGYLLKNRFGEVFYEVRKQPSFWGRRFMVNKHSDALTDAQEERFVLSLVLLVLKDRRRG